MADFTWLDYIFFLVFFICALMGLARGIVREVISLAAIIVALIITIKFTLSLTYFLYYTKGSYDVIVFISKYISPGSWGRYIALFTLDLSVLLLFIGTVSVCEAVNHYVFADAFTSSVLSLMYKLAGSIVGLMRGYIFNVVLILVLSITPVAQDAAWRDSRLISQLIGAVQKLGERIQPGGFGSFTEGSQYRP